MTVGRPASPTRPAIGPRRTGARPICVIVHTPDVPSATELVHEELADHGPMSREELLQRFDGLSEPEVDTALEHLASSGELTVADGGYDVT